MRACTEKEAVSPRIDVRELGGTVIVGELAGSSAVPFISTLTAAGVLKLCQLVITNIKVLVPETKPALIENSDHLLKLEMLDMPKDLSFNRISMPSLSTDH